MQAFGSARPRTRMSRVFPAVDDDLQQAANNLRVCSDCGHRHRLITPELLAQMLDDGSGELFDVAPGLATCCGSSTRALVRPVTHHPARRCPACW